MIQDCVQLGIDNDWDLTRQNACHIGNQNEEMGMISEDIISINEEVVYIKNDIANIKVYQGLNLWIWGVIAVAIIGLVIKKMWGKC